MSGTIQKEEVHIEELDFKSGAIQKEDIQTDKPHDLKGGGQEKKTIENFGTRTCGNYSSNRRRGIQDTTPRNITTNWVNGGGGQNYKDINTCQNCRVIGGYITISCCIGGDYRNYSRRDICLKGYEILSFHFLSFYKDFVDEIRNTERG